MRYRLTGLALEPDLVEDRRRLEAALARILGVETTDLASPTVVKHSLDARRRPARHVWAIDVEVLPPATARPHPPRGTSIRPLPEEEPDDSRAPPSRPGSHGGAGPGLASLPPSFRPVVVGAGPSGLFAALALARLGAPPLLLDRGQPVASRRAAIERLNSVGELDPENNMLFGEGGAGAFSDGKIYTRSRNPEVSAVLRELVDLGASPRILIEARPHVGADRLSELLESFRTRLTDLGVELRYGARVTSLVREGDRIVGVQLADGSEVRRSPVVMAPGHSARDTFALMRDAGVPMEAWSSAMGLRVEHPQSFIDRVQYKMQNPRARGLPAASYHLAWHGRDGRGAYTFCMCPGGRIVAASNLPGHIVTNGSADAARDGRWASAGVVVQVRTEDYAPFGEPGDPLIGLRFQAAWEQKAAELGGGLVAPAQRVVDYLDDRPSADPLETSYRPGTRPANLRSCLPRDISDSLAGALVAFGRRLRGFDGPLATLVGVETRTSSPVRLLRDDSCRSYGLHGFYPVGEGAGYAGGIVSAAVDGLRAAAAVVEDARTRVAAESSGDGGKGSGLS